jgi:hypothetical protein
VTRRRSGRGINAAAWFSSQAFGSRAPSRPPVSPLVRDCAKLFTRGTLRGKRVTATRWGHGFSWCVLNLQGSPLVLCHDAVVALDWFGAFESETEDAWAHDLAHYSQHPHRAPTDDEFVEETRDQVGRRLYLLGFLEQWEIAS